LITTSKRGKIGLVFLATLLILFGLFVLMINVTLLYKGMNAVETEEVFEGKNVQETREQTVSTKAVSFSVSANAGEEIGKLHIPKLNIIIPIFHGTSDQELQKGVGHVAGTAFPGEKNNSVLTGHRDTVFRKLGEITSGDVLKVESDVAVYTYKVRKTRIVEAEDLTVIVPKRKATLTLSTCYPFTYIGPAKQRYVLVADLISSTLKRV
jgi:sortase A